MPPRSFRRGRGTPPGHPAAPSSVPACGWAGPGLLDSHRPEPPGPSSSGTARGPPAGSGRGHRISSPGLPSCPSALCVVLGGVPRATGWHPQMAIPMVRTWWQRRSGFLPGFRHQCNKVRRKEGSGQGWLVKTQVCLFKTDKLTQVRTLRHPETSTLSFVSAITLCIRSDCFSLTARALESSLRLSPELPFHGGFYPVSTPITTIRHRWSSFCTWPTYLPLSPESFSRCRLRWTTPPSPQCFFYLRHERIICSVHSKWNVISSSQVWKGPDMRTTLQHWLKKLGRRLKRSLDPRQVSRSRPLCFSPTVVMKCEGIW